MLFTCGKDSGRQGQLKFLNFSCIYCIFFMYFYDELSNVTGVILYSFLVNEAQWVVLKMVV